MYLSADILFILITNANIYYPHSVINKLIDQFVIHMLNNFEYVWKNPDYEIHF